MATVARSPDSCAPFELEASVAEFAADAGRRALQLPRLTTGQRKQARKFVEEQHPALRCENVGVGAERRLVLLKAGAAAPAAPPPQATAATTRPDVTGTDDATPNGRFSDGSGVMAAGVEAAGALMQLDLAEAIAAFSGDCARTAWELPRLSTGQRREVKKIVERYPELRCESFGFGEERRLHLFKVSSPEDGAGAAAPAPPLSLPLRRLACAAEAAGTGDVAGDCSSNASTCDSFPTSAGGLSGGSSKSGNYTPLPEGLQVRNTFICSVDAETPDPRAVQSMPASMFRRCLLEELAAARRPRSSGASAVTDAAGGCQAEAAMAPGAEVEIHGLLKCPDFNGARGAVHRFDAATGRYDVVLDGARWAKVRTENLRAL